MFTMYCSVIRRSDNNHFLIDREDINEDHGNNKFKTRNVDPVIIKHPVCIQKKCQKKICDEV